MRFILFYFLSSLLLIAEDINYLEVKPEPGDGIATLFQRYEIPFTNELLNQFMEMNKSRLSKKIQLILSRKYYLPISIVKFNGHNIRSSINNNDYEYAKKIEEYNDRLFKKSIKPNDFRKDFELWVPLWDLKSNKKITKLNELQTIIEPLFGPKYKEVKQKDKLLEGCIYYLISGHGGPDPGAIGKTGGFELHEDEYAYDITLRLAHKLMEHSAKVYIIVQDPNDGIRDEAYLNNSFDEHYYGGDSIPYDQKERLQKRVKIVNELYQLNKKKSRLQRTIIIHVDSRSYGKRIDIFFYYALGNNSGLEFSNTLLKTIEEKYKTAQPNRGYYGSVTERNLFVLKNLLPVTTFIELGNIRNEFDRLRLIKVNNRQAIANWLCEGIIKDAKN